MSRERMRCFIEREGASWKAYCVEVDLSAEGNTLTEARAHLDVLLERYCYEFDDGVPAARALRRPPLSCRMKYSAARLLGHDTAAESRQCYDFHAPPQLLAGLA